MSLPDQIDVEPRLGVEFNDEDSIMEDVPINAGTPRTSLATSDSQWPSGKSTRASTPTDSHAENVSINNPPFEPLEHDEVADNVTMKDHDQNFRSSTQAPDDFRWSSIDAGLSPGKAGQSERKPVNYHAEPQNFEDLVPTNDLYTTNLYGP